MKKFETSTIKPENKFGVLKYRVESYHFVINIRWKDGKKALKILEENATKITLDEFS